MSGMVLIFCALKKITLKTLMNLWLQWDWARACKEEIVLPSKAEQFRKMSGVKSWEILIRDH